MSNAPVAAATIPPVDDRSKGSSRRLFIGALWAAAAAAAFSVFRATSANRAPAAALAPPALVTSTGAEGAARATVSMQASASPIEATLYLDGRPLPSNPYAGQVAADGTLHLLRAEAPGYANGNRAFVANREVAIVFALAKTGEPPRAPGKKARPLAAASAASASAPAATVSKPDDCKVSPYYVDDRNIKVVRPECLRSP
jgi:hypothetical protein